MSTLKFREIKADTRSIICPSCGITENHVTEATYKCPTCGMDFSDIQAIEITQDSFDNNTIIGEVNKIISDKKKDIIDILTAITVEQGEESSDKKNENSFIISITIYYIPLSTEREYHCSFEQIVRYESYSVADPLRKEWLNKHQGRSILSTLNAGEKNGTQMIDMYGVNFN